MNTKESQSLERMLQYAVLVSWTDLMRGAQTGLIHIEYGFAGGTLDYLKFLSSISRGHWLLALEYWTSPSKSHSIGVHFDNGYESETLKHILDSVMQHQNEFSLPVDFGRQGLLQVATPTQQESVVASAFWSTRLSTASALTRTCASLNPVRGPPATSGSSRDESAFCSGDFDGREHANNKEFFVITTAGPSGCPPGHLLFRSR